MDRHEQLELLEKCVRQLKAAANEVASVFEAIDGKDIPELSDYEHLRLEMLAEAIGDEALEIDDIRDGIRNGMEYEAID